MRKVIWKFKPQQSKNAKYSPDVAKEDGLRYIEQLKLEDDVAEVIEESDKFVIYLKDEQDK